MYSFGAWLRDGVVLVYEQIFPLLFSTCVCMRLSDTATAPSEPKLIKKSMPFSVSVGPWNFNQRRLGCSRQATKSHARTAEHGHTGDGEAQIHYYYTQIYPTNAVSSKVVKVFFLFSLSSSAPRIILLVSLIQANVKNDISLTYKLPSNSFRLCALFFFTVSIPPPHHSIQVLPYSPPALFHVKILF